jgi:hypothetical protein
MVYQWRGHEPIVNLIRFRVIIIYKVNVGMKDDYRDSESSVKGGLGRNPKVRVF